MLTIIASDVSRSIGSHKAGWRTGALSAHHAIAALPLLGRIGCYLVATMMPVYQTICACRIVLSARRASCIQES